MSTGEQEEVSLDRFVENVKSKLGK
jgi:hypothetical protein